MTQCVDTSNRDHVTSVDRGGPGSRRVIRQVELRSFLRPSFRLPSVTAPAQPHQDDDAEQQGNDPDDQPDNERQFMDIADSLSTKRDPLDVADVELESSDSHLLVVDIKHSSVMVAKFYDDELMWS